MSENEAVLIGIGEIARFMRISEASLALARLRKRHKDIPLYQEGKRGQVCADKAALSSWQRKLYAG